MRRLLPLWLGLCVLLSGCAAPAAEPETVEALLSFTDDAGNRVDVTSTERVVALYGSFAEIWLNAGGTLCAVTEDALSERHLPLGDEVQSIGTVKSPDPERILELEPTLVLLSADIEPQMELYALLRELSVPCAAMRVDGFPDYLRFLRLCCTLTGREELWEENGLAVERRIEELRSSVPAGESPTVLLLRAYSKDIRAKSGDNFAAAMLTELGAHNIAEDAPSLLEELSLEALIRADPDYIFVVPMGDEEAAAKLLREGIGANAGWQSLTAVREGRLFLLPKELFHYKPNARWAESYEMLLHILYPDVE